MKVEKISSRGLFFSFEDPYYTNVHVILGNYHVFILDTFLGNDSMRLVQKTIAEEGHSDKPIVVFNSHADYDHYWGNGAFKDAMIIGHEQCKSRILAEGEASLVKYADHQRGVIELIPPNRTFQETLRFEKDGVEFFHTPGHTLDSASCYDMVDKILFVGDNVESPFPYLNH
ncbi:MAG: MBL fold metallo-hydrolase, partial [Candidatus Thorarchaeota archaeon]